MSIKATLRTEMTAAMKARDKQRLESIRGLLAAIQHEELSQNADEITSEETIAVVKREIRKSKEQQESAEQANRAEEIAKAKAEIAVFESFLPSQIGESELEKVVTDLKAKDPAISMSLVMKHLKDTYPGQFDGKIASLVTKRVLG